MDVFHVVATQQTHDIVDQLSLLGYDKEIKAIVAEVVNDVADYCLAGLKSNTPIETFQMRGNSLADGACKKSNVSNYYANVEIAPDAHTNPRRKGVFPADYIAEILDEGFNTRYVNGPRGGKFHRTQNSKPIFSNFYTHQQGSELKDWIRVAQNEVSSSVQDYIIRRTYGQSY